MLNSINDKRGGLIIKKWILFILYSLILLSIYCDAFIHNAHRKDRT